MANQLLPSLLHCSCADILVKPPSIPTTTHFCGGSIMHTDFPTSHEWHVSISPFRVSLCYILILHRLNPVLGSSVSVECALNVGRDVISLRCASLSPSTIRSLMTARSAILLEKKMGKGEDNP